jgi:hypothetical protein
MKKRESRKVRLRIKRQWPFFLILCWLGLSGPLGLTLASGLPNPPSPDILASADIEKLLYQAGRLEPFPGREGTGTVTWKTPDEWMRLRFRLLARGPDALRMELFDPFGRPVAYFFSYEGRFFLISNQEKREINPQALREGPLAVFSEIPTLDLLKVLWGRIPIIPYERVTSEPFIEKEAQLVKLFLEGVQKQSIWLSSEPFSVLKTRIQNRKTGSDWQIAFSDFMPEAGGRVPKQIEIQDESREKTLTLRYEMVIPRQDIPESAFTAE